MKDEVQSELVDVAALMRASEKLCTAMREAIRVVSETNDLNAGHIVCATRMVRNYLISSIQTEDPRLTASMPIELESAIDEAFDLGLAPERIPMKAGPRV